MKRIHWYLGKENEAGFSYIEVLIAMAIFAISIPTIFSMIFSASKNTISGKRYYEATIMAQNLSEEVKKEIGKRLVNDEALGTLGDPQSLATFLDASDADYSAFNEAFKGEEYEYDVYIKKTDGADEYRLIEDSSNIYTLVHIDGGSTITVPTISPETITELDLSDSDPNIFGLYGGGTPPTDRMDFGYDGTSWSPSDTYSTNESQIELTWNDSSTPPRYNIVVDNPLAPNDELEDSDRIEINLDASKLEDETFELDIRLENKTKATVILIIYRENEVSHLDENIEVFPIQTDPEGNIFIERKTKVTPQGNYIIRIIVRDKKNGSKILKDMVEIYAHDYRTTTY